MYDLTPEEEKFRGEGEDLFPVTKFDWQAWLDVPQEEEEWNSFAFDRMFERDLLLFLL